MEREDVIKRFSEFIEREDYPCLMSKGIFRAGNYRLKMYKNLGDEKVAGEIINHISDFINAHDFESKKPESFIAVFPGAPRMSEEKFEELLWQQLSFIHKKDSHEWDETVNKDPESNNFSFSICGKAFYVIGMHPNSSRIARRAPYPALVFNLHHQFEQLRERGMFEELRQRIRNRDIQLQGSANPMLKDFGHGSEAKQYSGRAVDKSWKCPFHSEKKNV